MILLDITRKKSLFVSCVRPVANWILVFICSMTIIPGIEEVE